MEEPNALNCLFPPIFSSLLGLHGLFFWWLISGIIFSGKTVTNNLQSPNKCAMLELSSCICTMKITTAVSRSIANNFECLTCAKQCAKCFIHIGSLNLHSKFRSKIISQMTKPLLYRWKTQVLLIHTLHFTLIASFYHQSDLFANSEPFCKDKKINAHRLNHLIILFLFPLYLL